MNNLASKLRCNNIVSTFGVFPIFSSKVTHKLKWIVTLVQPVNFFDTWAIPPDFVSYNHITGKYYKFLVTCTVYFISLQHPY